MPRTPRALRRTAAWGTALATCAGVLTAAAPAASAATPVPVLVNAGGGTLQSNGTWSADRGAVGGRPTATSAAIAGTLQDALHQRQRVGMSAYRLPVANGTYALTLHFTETYFTAPDRRVFDISAEGLAFASRLDLFRVAGKNRAHRVTRQVVVRDGRLDLGFRAIRNHALLAGIELRPVVALTAPSAPQSVTVTSSGAGSAVLAWAPPADLGGSAISAYRVIRLGYDSTGAGPWTTVLPGTARSFTFDRLLPGTSYDFVVYGRNATGASPQVKVTLVTPSAPSTDSSVEAPVPAPTEESAPVQAPTASLATRSGLSWPSGVFVPGNGRTRYDAFADWRGRPLDVAVDWSARATWSDIVDPGWLYDKWAGTPGLTKVFGVAMVPEQDSTSTLATCATGAHNAQWRQFGSNIRARGLDDETVIRLGWEFNGDWYKWSAHDPAAFKACWRQIVTSVEATAPALRWDWTVNRGTGQSVSDPTTAYPGDDVVDIVGVDSYDGWPGAVDEASWQKHYAGAYGLKFWADFARSHGKKLSVPEWGVYPGTAWAGNNGGDNPFYIAKMAAFFRQQGSHLAYEAYFNESASYYAGSLYGPTQAPAAAAEYLRQYQ